MRTGDFPIKACNNAGMSPQEMPWDDLQLLRLLAREGSAAGAARALSLDQTTVSRRLARLERDFGGALFERLDRRLKPMPAVVAALEPLERMSESAALTRDLMRAAQSDLSGAVRISAVGSIAWVLSAHAATLAVAHKDLSLAIEVDNRNVSLARREADIALRFGRPANDTAVARRLANIRFCLAGPAHTTDPAVLPLVAYGEGFDHLPEARWLGELFPGLKPSLRLDAIAARIEAVAGGCRAALPGFVVAAEPRLAELPTATPGPSRELWLMVHPDRRRDAAVVAVIRWIEDTLRHAGL